MNKFFFILLSVFGLVVVSQAQLKIVSIEKIPVPAVEPWSHPVFSPSGNELFFTTKEYDGIWQYDLATKLMSEITHDRQSGFEFSLSEDGRSIAYRRLASNSGVGRDRVQESVVREMGTTAEQVIQRGLNVSTPKYIHNAVSSVEIEKRNASPLKKTEQGIYILGIDNTKIMLLKDGTVVTFDPFGGGRYIWPALSPDKKSIAAVEMDHGAFIWSVDGSSTIKLGKCNNPSWTRDGRWIIGMDDRDDGQVTYASDIVAFSNDGKSSLNLTSSSDMIAMFPHCSPTENKIVFNSTDGNIFILTYTEGR